MKTFVLSDLHLGHANIIRYCIRPFNSVEEMDSVLIKNWNDTVSKEDTVFYLGDLAFGKGSMHYTEDYREILNGDITFIRGNHYDPKRAKLEPLKLDYDYEGKSRRFILCHWPEKLGRKYSPENRVKAWLIHGHWHNNEMQLYPFINGKRRTVNVSVELTGYKPVDIDHICKLIDEGIRRMDRTDTEPVYAFNALSAHAT